MGTDSTYRFPFAKYPAVRLALLYSAGIFADFTFNIPNSIWLTAMAACFTVILFIGILNRKTLHPRSYHLEITAYILLSVFFGGWRHSISVTGQDNRLTPASLLEVYAWESMEFRGRITDSKPSSNGKFLLDLFIHETRLKDSLSWHHPYRLRAVHMPDSSKYIKQLPAPGSDIYFIATIYPLEEPRNPGEFDYKAFLQSKRMAGQVGIDSILSVSESGSQISWNTIRYRVLTLIEQNFGPKTAPLAKALLIGYKNELDREKKLSFSRAGLSHIMAVSGLHVGFIIAPVWFIIPYLWTLRFGKPAGFLLMTIILLFYAGLTGFSASVCRASLTGAFITYGRLFHKVRDSKNLTAVSALIILLINPGQLFEIGFQLSFSAVYIILLITPVINRMLPKGVRYRWYGAPIMIVLVSLVVQVGLYPLLAYYFGEFSLIGPLANAAVVPLLTLAVPAGLLLLAVSIPFPAAGNFLNMPIRKILEFVDQLVELISSWEWSWIQARVESPTLFLIWLVGIFLATSLYYTKIRWRLLAVFLLLLSIVQIENIIKKLTGKNLEILVFDVGQGDAILVSTPAESHFLIDTGRWTPNFNSARYTIIPYLEMKGIKKLNAVFLSHPHADHIGGMPELIDSVPIDTIYHSGFPYSSALYSTYRSKAAEQNIPVIPVKNGVKIHIDTSIRLFIYGPGSRIETADPNEHSLILEVIYGNTEFLFTGDAGISQEKKIVSSFPDLVDADFLKVGHHGSRTSSSMQFLEYVSPEIAVVSLAKENRFGHPHTEAIYRLNSFDINLYFTSLEGALLFQSDGEHISRVNWR